MNNNLQKVERYLAELNTALHGQSAGLIQDAMYDAQNHLQDALSEQDADFEVIVAQYGAAPDIAQQYIQLEAQTQQFLSGKRLPPRVNGFFEPLFDSKAYGALGYFLISLPLSLTYFAWFALVGISSISLSLVGVGIPFLALYLKLQGYLALFEGQLVSTLLGERMPRRPMTAPIQKQPKYVIQRIIKRLKKPLGWKTTLYTAIQLPLASVYFALCVCLFFASIALMLSPIVDPILNYFFPSHSIDIAWYWIPLTIPAGTIGITLSLYVASALSKLQRAIARTLLIEKI